MKFADRLKFSSTGTSAAAITVVGAITGCRTLAQAISDGALAVGDTNIPFTVDDGSGNWEDSYFTITSATQITRTQVLSSSAGGTSAATFGGSQLTVYNSVPSAMLGRVACDRDVSFSQTVPLDQVGMAYMTPPTTGGPFTFAPGPNAVKGAFATCRVTADGASSVTCTGFKEIVDSGGYIGTSGTVNIFTWTYDGYSYLFSVTQEPSASSTGDTTAPVMAGSLSSSNITAGGFTLTWSVATDNVAVTGYEVSTNGGASYTPAGNVTTWTATGMSANTAYSCSVRAFDAASNKATPISLTVTTAASSDTTAPTMSGAITVSNITQIGYTLAWAAGADNVGVAGYEISVDGGASYPYTTASTTYNVTGRTAGTTDQVRVRDYDAAGNRGTPLSASVTTSAATVPGAPTIGAATAGNASASVTFTAPGSNGGSAITGYTVTSTPGGITATGAGSPINVTGLTNGTAYTFTVHATNAVGSSAESAASSSVTPAVQYPRMATLLREVESGTGPYTYTGSGATGFTGSSGDSVCTKALQSGVDGELVIKILTAGVVGGNEVFFGVDSSSANIGYASVDYAAVGHTDNGYAPFTNGTAGANSSTLGAVNDYQRIRRVGSTLTFDVSKDSGSTWTNIATWTGVSTGVMYFHGIVTYSGAFTPISSSGLA